MQQPGDDRFAVLGDHQGAPFRQPAALFRADDRNVLPGERAAGDAAGLPGRETRVWPTRSEISWLNAPSLEPLKITNTLVRLKARATQRSAITPAASSSMTSLN
jgi:hypothetical protein